MAKYCSKCGKLLQKNEKCNCQDSQKNERKRKIKEFLQENLTIYKEIFTKPIDTIKSYTNKPNMLIAITQVILFMLAFGIYAISISKSLYVLYGIITKQYFTAIYNANINKISLTTQVPYFNIFLIAVLFIIILSILTVVSIYLVNLLLFKSKSNIKRVFCLYSINTVLPTIFLIICTLIALISFKISIIVLFFVIVLSNIYLFSGIKFISVKDDNKYAYTYIISMILVFIILYIIFKLI